MREPLDMTVSPELDAVVFVGPAQCGKGVPFDTLIATPNGWTTAKDIKQGDKIFAVDGSITIVTGVSPVHNLDCYEIQFDDGEKQITDATHRWAVKNIRGSDRQKTHILETQMMAKNYLNPNNTYSVDVCAPLRVPQIPLPMDPYLYGLWLGDRRGSPGYLTVGYRDSKAIVNVLTARGHEVSDDGWTSDSKMSRKITVAGMHASLIHTKATVTKTIPQVFKRASVQQRTDLLRGIIDARATVDRLGRISFSLQTETLENEVCEIVSSLGIKIDRTTKKKSFVTREPDEICSLVRHTDKIKLLAAGKSYDFCHSRRRIIRRIKPVSSVPTICFMVDHPEHLYLVGRAMIPTHNTELILNWVGYSIRTDPSDMTIFSPTMANARDFSNRRIDRLHRDSPLVGAELLGEKDSDNKFDKNYKNGTILGLAWPTKSELAGKPIPRIALTDRDRMDDDIEKEGDPFDLASKRTTSFGSFKMTLCESSPSRDITDFRYVVKSPHEAPPTKGILALYNRGDRRRWYMPCGRCGEFLEPRFERLIWEPHSSILDAADSVKMKCAVCDGLTRPDERFTLAQSGIWVPDDCAIIDGKLIGEPRRSKIASYWLEGCAAAFTNWPALVASYLTAEEEFERTLNEEPLKKFYNTDLGRPYRPKASATERTPEDLMALSEKLGDFGRNADTGEIEIISDIAFLMATVDVQTNMFVVMFWGIVPGDPYDLVVVDRLDIKKSKRYDEEGDVHWVKTGSYLEDWDLLIENVIHKSYPIQGRNARMAVRLVGCDSGGKAGVTANAYAFWRKLKGEGLGHRFLLLKGSGMPNIPHIRETMPDSNDKKNIAVARGDVPVWQMNSNLLKNQANNRLATEVPGKGMVRIPRWHPAWLFKEFCSEILKDKGWDLAPGIRRNEAWDLLYYVIAICQTRYIRIERPDFWSSPPIWAQPLAEQNPYILRDATEVFAEPKKTKYDLKALASKLAGSG